jgi:hypothetical protein
MKIIIKNKEVIEYIEQHNINCENLLTEYILMLKKIFQDNVPNNEIIHNVNNIKNIVEEQYINLINNNNKIIDTIEYKYVNKMIEENRFIQNEFSNMIKDTNTNKNNDIIQLKDTIMYENKIIKNDIINIIKENDINDKINRIIDENNIIKHDIINTIKDNNVNNVLSKIIDENNKNNNQQITLLKNELINIITNNDRILLTDIEYKMNKMSENKNDIILLLKDIINDMNNLKNEIIEQENKIVNNSSIKGKIGEDKLQNILNYMYNDIQIENTTIGGCCDYHMYFDFGLVLVETKDYKNNIPSQEIEKFIDDISRYNSHGLFLSQNSGICGKKNFQIDVHNDNILVYIHNVQYNQDIIRIGIDIIQHFNRIVKNVDTNIIIDKCTLELIHNEYIKFCNNIEEYKDELKHRCNQDIKRFDNMKLRELSLYLSQYYSLVNENFKCNNCNQHFKNKRGLNVDTRHDSGGRSHSRPPTRRTWQQRR